MTVRLERPVHKSLDEITGMSRQRRWQERRIAAGLCQICGKPRTAKGSDTMCPKHRTRNAKLAKRRYQQKRKVAA